MTSDDFRRFYNAFDQANDVQHGNGIPLACTTPSASPAEVELAAEVLSHVPFSGEQVIPVIADQAYDSDPFREELRQQNYQLACPHRKNRKRPKKQDERKLRRCRHRWIIERTISWISNFRRLTIRHENKYRIYEGFMTIACIAVAQDWRTHSRIP